MWKLRKYSKFIYGQELAISLGFFEALDVCMRFAVNITAFVPALIGFGAILPLLESISHCRAFVSR